MVIFAQADAFFCFGLQTFVSVHPPGKVTGKPIDSNVDDARQPFKLSKLEWKSSKNMISWKTMPFRFSSPRPSNQDHSARDNLEHSSSPTSLNYPLQTKLSDIRASNNYRLPWFFPNKAHAGGKGRPNIVDSIEGKWERIPLYGASSTRLPCKTFRQKWTLNVYLAYHRTGYLGDTALFNGHGYIADPSFIEGCFESGSKRLGRFWDIYASLPLCIVACTNSFYGRGACENKALDQIMGEQAYLFTRPILYSYKIKQTSPSLTNRIESNRQNYCSIRPEFELIISIRFDSIWRRIE
jgi:hypothetical protein